MTNHKGYYIDNVIFSSKEDIDNFIKKQAVDRFVMLNKLFAERPDMGISIACSEQADRLHNQFGFTWEEIEEIELAAIA